MSYLGDVFNPPDYYNAMITDPTQVPVQMYPGGGYPYGYPGGAVFGPYPGFYLGQRTMDASDAIRLAKAKQEAMERRAETSEIPEYKYIDPAGRLDPRHAAALKVAKTRAVKAPIVDPVAAMQKRIITTVLIAAALSTLLR